MRVLVTGVAGFIGAATAHRLLERGDEVIGIDNLNDYYDPTLKSARVQQLSTKGGFEFIKMDCADQTDMATLFQKGNFDSVIHLAAQAGVRYSLDHPFAYLEANLNGFLTVLEGCRHHAIKHLVYASSSSVYGSNEKLPFSVEDSVDHPISLYAATKKSNEQMAHVYAHLFGVPSTGLRFFTVYGPWGRPDMALFKFVQSILNGEPISVFGEGQQTRDFTFIDDIVEGILRTLDQPATPNPNWDAASPDPGSSSDPWRVYNIGGGQPVPLLDFISCIETCLGQKARVNLLPMQPGDVRHTKADVQALHDAVGYTPTTPVEIGVPRFVEWYRAYYGV